MSVCATDVFQRASETGGQMTLASQVSSAHPANQPHVSQSPVLSDNFLETATRGTTGAGIERESESQRGKSVPCVGTESNKANGSVQSLKDARTGTRQWTEHVSSIVQGRKDACYLLCIVL